MTLHEYPCLENCLPLIDYITACVRLAWKMANHTVPYFLDLDFTLGNLRTPSNFAQPNHNLKSSGILNLDKHDKHPSSNERSDIIRAFIWPALIQNQRCVFKAVIAT